MRMSEEAAADAALVGAACAPAAAWATITGEPSVMAMKAGAGLAGTG